MKWPKTTPHLPSHMLFVALALILLSLYIPGEPEVVVMDCEIIMTPKQDNIFNEEMV